MSTWTGINTGGPESITTMTCTWQMCTIYVPKRFHDAGLLLCREHALLAWSIVNEQLAAGETFESEEPAKTDQPTPAPGIVYYVRTGGRIKIGHTVNIYRRLSQYPPDIEVLYLRPGTKDLERTEHQRFRAYLSEGREWFQDRHEVTEPIEAMAAVHSWRGLIGGDWWRRRTSPTMNVRHTKRK